MAALRFSFLALLALAGCSRSDEQKATPVANQAVGPYVPAPGTGPDAKTPLGPVEPAIDTKSVQAAAKVVEEYADLLEHQHYTEAAALWNDRAAADRFAAQLNPEVHVEIGRLGATEGAAGSIYTTIPAVFFGDTYRKPSKVILRRVNDVPGSTEQQRHWHIERIDWAQ